MKNTEAYASCLISQEILCYHSPWGPVVPRTLVLLHMSPRVQPVLWSLSIWVTFINWNLPSFQFPILCTPKDFQIFFFLRGSSAVSFNVSVNLEFPVLELNATSSKTLFSDSYRDWGIPKKQITWCSFKMLDLWGFIFLLHLVLWSTS